MNKIISFIAVVALIIGVTALVKPNKDLAVKQGTQGERGLQGQQGAKGDKGEQGVKGLQGAKGESGSKGENVNLGALSGPDIPYFYLGVGGLRNFFNSSPLSTSTTTPCAFQANATSTLVSGGVKFTVSSTTATTITIAKATTPTATTTWIHNGSLAANAQGTFIVPGATTTNQIFGPNEWFVVGMSGGNGTFSPTGVCHAIFESYEQ